jgi:hypothetical protein
MRVSWNGGLSKAEFLEYSSWAEQFILLDPAVSDSFCDVFKDCCLTNSLISGEFHV